MSVVGVGDHHTAAAGVEARRMRPVVVEALHNVVVAVGVEVVLRTHHRLLWHMDHSDHRVDEMVPDGAAEP